MVRIAFRNGVCAAVLLTVAVWAGCQSEPTDPALRSDLAELHLCADVSGTNIAAIVVEVTGADIPQPLIFNIPIENGNASGVLTVPAGSERVFTVRAYDANSIETHRGQATMNVVAGGNPPLTVVLYPLVGDVVVEVEIAQLVVTLEPSEAVVLVGQSVQLVATVTDGAGNTVSGEVSWGSRQPLVARVDENGLVTGVDEGDTEIVANFGNVRSTAEVRVEWAPRQAIVGLLGVTTGNSGNPPPTLAGGYTLLPIDLNRGAGGDFIWIYYKLGLDDGSTEGLVPVNRVYTVDTSDGEHDPYGGTLASVDLNKGAGGDFIYLYFTRGFGNPARCVVVWNAGEDNDEHNYYWGPVTPVDNLVTYDPSDVVWARQHGTTSLQDLNEGSGGDFIYVGYCPDH